MTPFDAITSGLVTFEVFTKTFEPVTRIRTAVGHRRELDQSPRDRFDVRLAFEGDLDEEQRARMIEIAGKCPVHKALTEGARFSIMESPEAAPAEPPEAHAEAMERVTERNP